MSTDIAPIDIRKLSLAQLEEWFVAAGEKKFRAKQIYER